MAGKTVPEGYSTISAYLVVTGAARAIDFYGNAFGAVEVMRLADPEGKVGHAELQVGDSRLMVADEFPEMGYRSPQSLGGAPTGLLLYVDDVDKVFARALAAGATEHQPVQDHFYGDRSGAVIDPFGHRWTIATRIEDVSPEEMQRRFEAAAPVIP